MNSLKPSVTSPRRLEVPQAQRRQPRKPLELYVRQARGDRDRPITTAYASGAYTQVELARYFELHYTTISRVIAQAEKSGSRPHISP